MVCYNLPINYNLSNPPYATQWDGRDNDQDWHYTGRHLYYDNYDSDNNSSTPNSYDHPANCQNGCLGDLYHYFGWDGVEEIYEDQNNKRLPNYHRLDASDMYDFYLHKEKSTKARLGISVINLYNRKNEIDKVYRLEGDTTQQLVAQTDIGLGTTFNMVFRVSF